MHAEAEDSWLHSKVVIVTVEPWRGGSKEINPGNLTDKPDRNSGEKRKKQTHRLTEGKKENNIWKPRKEMSMGIDLFSCFFLLKGKSEWWSWAAAVKKKVKVEWKRSRSTHFWVFNYGLGTHFRLRAHLSWSWLYYKIPNTSLCV